MVGVTCFSIQESTFQFSKEYQSTDYSHYRSLGGIKPVKKKSKTAKVHYTKIDLHIF